MCTGLEILSAVGSGLSIGKSLFGGGDTKPPDVVAQNPVADQTAIDTQAAQDAAAKKLDMRRAARVNSLLSSYGGQGDTSAVSTTSGSASGKVTLGA
jgi:hypothetical protein